MAMKEYSALPKAPASLEPPHQIVYCHINRTLVCGEVLSLRRWSFTGVWVTGSLLKSPALFSVFWPTSFWMVFARPPIFISNSPFTKPLGIVPSTPITNGITVTFMFHVTFFSSLARSQYLSLFFFSFSLIFILWSTGSAKSFFSAAPPVFLFVIYR